MARRDVLAGVATVVGVAAWPGAVWGESGKVVKSGRIRQAICGGCLQNANLDIEKTASLLAGMGLGGMDFAGRNDWPILQRHGLVATLVACAGSIKRGLNDKSMHATFLSDFKTNIKAAAEYRWPNVITMAGDRLPGLCSP